MSKLQKAFVSIIAASVLVTVVTACEASNEAPQADSDSQQQYNEDGRIPVDDNVYVITGTVQAPIDSLERQVEPAEGGISGFVGAGGPGFVSGWYSGPEFQGKGFLRLLVSSTVPSTSYAVPGRVAILKTSDTKARVLEAGDEVTLKCRLQYEAVAAVRENEDFDQAKVETWEIDYCRLATPVITTDGGF